MANFDDIYNSEIVSEHIKKYIAICTSSEPINEDKAKMFVRDLYNNIFMKPKPDIIIANGPRDARRIAYDRHKNAINPDKRWRKQYTAELKSMRANVRNNISKKIKKNLQDRLKRGEYYKMENEFAYRIHAEPKGVIESSITNLIESKFDGTPPTHNYSVLVSRIHNRASSVLRSINMSDTLSGRLTVPPFLLGQFMSPKISMYDFMVDRGLINNSNLLSKYLIFREVINFGVIYTLDKLCTVSKRPKSISLNANNQLHNEDGPALEYRDGSIEYRMNGIPMPKEFILTPRMDLDPKEILRTRNADVRREMVKKIGINRILNQLDCKVNDEYGSYRLLSLDLGDWRYRPYLQMLNPSTGDYHIEGVHPSCRTVVQALKWRNDLEHWQEPEILT